MQEPKCLWSPAAMGEINRGGLPNLDFLKSRGGLPDLDPTRFLSRYYPPRDISHITDAHGPPPQPTACRSPSSLTTATGSNHSQSKVKPTSPVTDL